MRLLIINLAFILFGKILFACPDSLERAFLLHLTENSLWAERLLYTQENLNEPCNEWKLEHAFSLCKIGNLSKADSIYSTCSELSGFREHRIYVAFKNRNLLWLNTQMDLPQKATYCLKLLNSQTDSLSNDPKYKRLNSKYLEWRAVDRKSVFLAGILSIIPGLGKAYCGYRKQAIMSLIVNAGLAAMLIEVIYKRGTEDALFYAISGIAGTFWAGSIYGTMASLKKEKNNQLDALYLEITERFLLDFADYPNSSKIAK